MASDASHVLEAALEQVDDIIAVSKAAGPESEAARALVPVPSVERRLAEELRGSLDAEVGVGHRNVLRRQLPTTTTHTLLLWLDKGLVNLRTLGNNESYQERLSRLEGDKESLVLQVSVLTDQVEAQGEKIRDLENSLEEHQHKLNSTEEMLQQELLSRTALETQKLDLMDEVSFLKLKLVGMEERQNHTVERQHNAEHVVNLISELQEQMCRIQQELSCKIREKQDAEAQELDPDEGAGASPAEALPGGAVEAEDGPMLEPGSGGLDAEERCCCGKESGLLQELRLLKNKVNELEDEKSQCEQKLKATKLSVSYSLHVCYQSLVTQLSSLRLSVEQLQVERQQWEERSRSLQAEISSLQQLLQCKNAEIENLQTQLLSRAPVSVDSSEREEIYRRRLHSKHQELQKLKAGMELLIAANNEKDRRIEELSLLLNHCRQFRDGMTLLQPLSALQVSIEEEEKSGGVRMKALAVKAHSELMSSFSSPLLVSTISTQKETEFSSQSKLLSCSMEDLKSGVTQKTVIGTSVQPVCSEKTPNSNFRPQMGVFTQTEGGMSDAQRSPESSENSDLLRCRSASAPILGKTERLQDTSTSDSSPVLPRGESDQQSPVSQEAVKNNKSIRRLWGKIRRTQSGGLQGDDLEPTEFKRGGFRATAGPRLARTPESARATRDMTVPFSKWTTEQVCGWLEDCGLGHYVNLTRQWVVSGQTLLLATPQQFEKEMGIKHPLHRKKLQLALRSFTSKAMEKSSELDHIWVTRWLDDIGLPQYKDQFHESRVDGKMLQYLTVNDLLFLKVTSQLHHLSIKCAIHVLHVNKFNPHCLRRRPGDENKTSPSEVVQWSNHRVMEWLRSVDLAEYAPNLRGSGVHGGLIILEPRFSSETLAMLLNIPPQKTLLRRHLATNFNNLVGLQAQQEKREYANTSGHTPLTTTAKVRPKKLGFTNFSHLRKRRPDDSADYICPVEAEASPVLNGTPHHTQAGFRGLSPMTDRNSERVDHVGPRS
ncbi:liprin-beta-2 isoform X1 [Electrophorus electricus]|uniref:liprin-beta-2 isoform X1 n=2 Tax=Electrophorus electricus TaxID=8005 RepID=UPI0015CFD0B2|nr:liprin-beta-2 isoform X1 [Electrophorus electricus]